MSPKNVFAVAALTALLSTTGALAQPGPQGPVTRDQYVAMAKQRFADMDADGDGAVTKADVTAQIAKRMGNAPPAQMVDRMFSRLDTNGDGKATMAEVEAAAIARFTQLDTDKDGTLSPQEQTAGRPIRIRD